MANLTVGIPIRNEEESVKKCLRAIKLSNLPENTEIIICDNCSTDNSLALVSELNIKDLIIVKERELGKIFAMNKIIDVASSNYIIFCDADILVKKDTIKKIYEKIKNSDLHVVGVGLVDISNNKFFKWYYKVLSKVQRDDLNDNAMGGCFGVNREKFGKFPRVLSTDFFMSSYYHFKKNGKLERCDEINVYYKKANTIKDVLMKKTRNRMKYLQIKKEFPELCKFQYERPLDWNKLKKNFAACTFLVTLLHVLFETIAYIIGTIVFYSKFENIGYSWRKAKSTKLDNVNPSLLDI